jgi:hypothetical protein
MKYFNLSVFCYVPVYMQRRAPNLAEGQAIYVTVMLVQGAVLGAFVIRNNKTILAQGLET